MTDVFIRTMQRGTTLADKIRDSFLEATLARWRMEDINFRLMVDMGIREARLRAEELAVSDPYIFTDEDVMPWGKNWLRRGLVAMNMNPEFGVCSSRSVIAEERGNYAIPEGTEILEMPAVGAPMWIRKGYMAGIPEFIFVEECIAVYDHFRKQGMKSGIIAGLEHLHLGFGFATDPKLVRGY